MDHIARECPQGPTTSNQHRVIVKNLGRPHRVLAEKHQVTTAEATSGHRLIFSIESHPHLSLIEPHTIDQEIGLGSVGLN